jgi:hypothetical protein
MSAMGQKRTFNRSPLVQKKTLRTLLGALVRLARDAAAMRVAVRTAPTPAHPARRAIRARATARRRCDDRRRAMKLPLQARCTQLLSLRARNQSCHSQYECSGRQSESEFSHRLLLNAAVSLEFDACLDRTVFRALRDPRHKRIGTFVRLGGQWGRD